MFMLALRLDAHVCPPRYSGAGSVCPDAGMNVMTMLCARLPLLISTCWMSPALCWQGAPDEARLFHVLLKLINAKVRAQLMLVMTPHM